MNVIQTVIYTFLVYTSLSSVPVFAKTTAEDPNARVQLEDLKKSYSFHLSKDIALKRLEGDKSEFLAGSAFFATEQTQEEPKKLIQVFYTEPGEAIRPSCRLYYENSSEIQTSTLLADQTRWKIQFLKKTPLEGRFAEMKANLLLYKMRWQSYEEIFELTNLDVGIQVSLVCRHNCGDVEGGWLAESKRVYCDEVVSPTTNEVLKILGIKLPLRTVLKAPR